MISGIPHGETKIPDLVPVGIRNTHDHVDGDIRASQSPQRFQRLRSFIGPIGTPEKNQDPADHPIAIP
jgi:hypothetical protein